MGTKAGAEKARQRRADLAAERERQGIAVAAGIEQSTRQLQQLSAPVADGTALIPADGPSDVDAPAVRLARQMLTAGAPMAADVVNRIIAGKIKAPAMVRANTALRALEIAGVPIDQKRMAGGEVGGGAARLLDALTRLKELRDRRAAAETVAPIAPAGAVEPST